MEKSFKYATNDIVCNASPFLLKGDIGFKTHTSAYPETSH